MSALSDITGYGDIIDRYIDAYDRLQVIINAPLNETDGSDNIIDVVKDDLRNSIPIEQVYEHDKIVTDYNQVNVNERAEIEALLAELKPSILEFLNDNSAITDIYSRTKARKIVPVDTENFDVLAWP